jgi:hypothetical protein
MYGTAHPEGFTVWLPNCSQSSLEGPGVARLGPPGDVDFMQLSKIRGVANGKVETSRGRKSPAQEYVRTLRECRRKRHIRVKRESLNPIIQEGKKGAMGLVIVFMKIRAVTDVF